MPPPPKKVQITSWGMRALDRTQVELSRGEENPQPAGPTLSCSELPNSRRQVKFAEAKDEIAASLIVPVTFIASCRLGPSVSRVGGVRAASRSSPRRRNASPLAMATIDARP